MNTTEWLNIVHKRFKNVVRLKPITFFLRTCLHFCIHFSCKVITEQLHEPTVCVRQFYAHCTSKKTRRGCNIFQRWHYTKPKSMTTDSVASVHKRTLRRWRQIEKIHEINTKCTDDVRQKRYWKIVWFKVDSYRQIRWQHCLTGRHVWTCRSTTLYIQKHWHTWVIETLFYWFWILLADTVQLCLKRQMLHYQQIVFWVCL